MAALFYALLHVLVVVRASETNGPLPSEEWVIRSWQTEEGLPQNTVNALLQTRDGFLWVGTSGGLARFDGVRFRNFGLHDGLRSVQISTLVEDHDGRLWVGTTGGGVSRWDNGRFVTFGGEGSVISVDALAADRDGSIWIGTAQGLVKWSNGKLQVIGPESGLPRKHVRALMQDSKGALWVSVLLDGLYRGTNGQFAPIQRGPSAPGDAYCLFEDRDGSVWSAGNGQLWRWRDGNWTRFGSTNGLPKTTLEGFAQQSDGTMWVTSRGSGLVRFRDGQFTQLTNNGEWTGMSLRAVTVDRDGGLWVGTASDGVMRLSRRLLHYWTTGPGLEKVAISSVAEDPSGFLWAGTRTRGIYQFQNGQFSKLDDPAATIYAVEATSDGSTWAAGEQCLLRLQAGKPAQKYLKAPVKGEAIRALCADGETLWMGTYYSTLLKCDTNGVRVVCTNGSFAGDITSLAREATDTLWIGTAGGLYRWERGTMRTWNTSHGLLAAGVRALHRDSDGTVWIGTHGGGLARLRNEQIFNITTRQGLIDDVISQIVSDDFGHLWLGCNRGIMRLHRDGIDALASGKIAELQPLVFGRNEGMLKEQCVGGHSPTAIKTRDGRLFFPTMGGLAEIDPRQSREYTTSIPQPTIDEVVIDGQPQCLGEALTVPPGKHRFEVHYAAPSPGGGEWLRFRYRLEGLDHDWVTAGTRRVAAYEALRPGHYVFRVAVRNAKGIWNEGTERLAFSVQPFYWQTGWFRGGVAVLVAAAIAAIVGGIAAIRRRRERHEFELARVQSSVLLRLSVHPAVTSGDLDAAFREICEKTASTLNVSRVGIWLADDAGSALRCANVFDATTGRHEAGQVVTLAGAPNYVEALGLERVLAVPYVRQDPRTAELSDAHFTLAKVASVMDAPVRVSQKLAGLIRHEQIGTPRLWLRKEVRFAGEMADLVARALSNAEREAANRHLRETEQHMTLAAEAAHLGMWIWEEAEKSFWTSDTWRSIHGYSPGEVVRYDTVIKRIHPDDRATVERAVAEAFRHRGPFYAQHRLCMPNGSIRWISASGRVEPATNKSGLRMLGVSIDITDRVEAEQAAREVSGKLITAQEDERRRIARDLHDDLNQRLALLSVETDLLGRMERDPEAQSLVSKIAAGVGGLSSEIHKLSYQLHPAKLEQLGLVAATRSFCTELKKQANLPIDFVYDDIPRDLNRDVALCLYRIVQEGLQNMVRHSRASSASVELRKVGNNLRLIVTDNGRGFDVGAAAHHAGLGLTGMRERVRLIRGRIEFQSAPGKGTRIEVRAPAMAVVGDR